MPSKSPRSSKKKQCTEKGYPCGYSCQRRRSATGKATQCKRPLSGASAEYQQWLKSEAPDKSEVKKPAKEQKQKITLARETLTTKGDRGLISAKLKPHLTEVQSEGVSKAIAAMDKEPGGFILADGTGTGKSRQILAIADTYAAQGKKVLIVSPNAVLKPDYKKGKVTGSFDKDSEAMGIDLALNKGTGQLGKGKINVATYQNLEKLKDQVDSDTVILFDEAHTLKNAESKQAQNGMAMIKSAGKVLYATATPLDKPEHLSYLYRADVFGGKSEGSMYARLGMKQRKVTKGGVTTTKWVIPKGEADSVYEALGEVFDEITKEGRMIKREIDMSGVGMTFHDVKMPPKARKMLKAIEDRYVENPADPMGKARMLLDQRRQLEPHKVPAAADLAKKAIAEGKQVVLFVSRVNESEVSIDKGEDFGGKQTVAKSKGTATLLKEALKKAGISESDIVELHGGAKTKPGDAMAAFQSGKARVIIATPESGGTGINLDDTTGDRPRELIALTPPFSANDNMQMMGRVWRLTTKSKPGIHFLFSDTEVDNWNRELLKGKMANLGAAVRGAADTLKFRERFIRGLSSRL